jgi:hypothetical protein
MQAEFFYFENWNIPAYDYSCREIKYVEILKILLYKRLTHLYLQNSKISPMGKAH